MSWDISIVNENNEIMECDASHLLRGGTVRANSDLEQISITEAELNITYNYSNHYATVWEDYEGLYEMFNDKKASDCIEDLEKAVSMLGIETDDNYWSSTRGNAGKAISDFLWLCKQCSEGKVKVS